MHVHSPLNPHFTKPLQSANISEKMISLFLKVWENMQCAIGVALKLDLKIIYQL